MTSDRPNSGTHFGTSAGASIPANHRPAIDARALHAALLGGLVGGAIDLFYAFIASGLNGVSPQRVLHVIASGWLGKAAYQGAWASAALGLVSHFVIVWVFALAYVVATRRLPGLNARPILLGAVYGAIIYGVMNYIVVPLSATNFSAPSGTYLVLGLLVHIFGVGVPIALFARRAS
jgi:uncharacterized membrane protein YagU involved in acid resistance